MMKSLTCLAHEVHNPTPWRQFSTPSTPISNPHQPPKLGNPTMHRHSDTSTARMATASPFPIDIQKHWKGFSQYVDFVNKNFNPGRGGIKPIGLKAARLPAVLILTKEEENVAYMYWVQNRESESWSWNPFSFLKMKPLDLSCYSSSPTERLPTPLEYHEFKILLKPKYETPRCCGHGRHPGDEVTKGERYCPVCIMGIFVEYMKAVDEAWKSTHKKDQRSVLRFAQLQVAWAYAKSRLVNAVENARERAEEEERVLARTLRNLNKSAKKISVAQTLYEKGAACEYSFAKAVAKGLQGLEEINNSPFQWEDNGRPGYSNVCISRPQNIPELPENSQKPKKTVSFVPHTKINEEHKFRPGSFNRTLRTYRPGIHACDDPCGWEDTSHSGDDNWDFRNCKLFICEVPAGEYEVMRMPSSTDDERYRGLLGQWEYCEDFFEQLPMCIKGWNGTDKRTMVDCDTILVAIDEEEDEDRNKSMILQAVQFKRMEKP